MKKFESIIKPDRLKTLKEIPRNTGIEIVGSKVFITEISDAMRIRTGQRGEDAL